jgi:hypothetical protein
VGDAVCRHHRPATRSATYWASSRCTRRPSADERAAASTMATAWSPASAVTRFGPRPAHAARKALLAVVDGFPGGARPLELLGVEHDRSGAEVGHQSPPVADDGAVAIRAGDEVAGLHDRGHITVVDDGHRQIVETQKPRLIDSATGEMSEVELFVAVLSNYIYAQATRTQQVPN